jgi:hypothetical protein
MTYAKGTPKEKTNLTGYQYMREVFPQLKVISNGKYLNDNELLAALNQGNQFFFDLAYGILNPNQTLGNKEIGDGYKFRGRGYIQITGRYIYEQIGKVLNIDLLNDPDLITKDADVAAKSALIYLARVFGNGKLEKGMDLLNSFKDTKTALQYVALGVASGSAGHNTEKLLAAKLKDTNFLQQLSKAEEKGSAVAKQAVYSDTKVAANSPPPPSVNGSQVAQESKQVALGQREQLQPTDVNVVNVQKTNNTRVANNQTKTVDKNQGVSADRMVARAT